ncbi:MAG: hypothetical protein JOZ31_10925 [Verrucomicrobia bacterium]|nr:hypothetical protein [Verrucomicrobiota bacterium]
MPRSFTDHVKLVNKRHWEGKCKSGVQEFRSSGVQEFRRSGVQAFRRSGVQAFGLGKIRELQGKAVLPV